MSYRNFFLAMGLVLLMSACGPSPAEQNAVNKELIEQFALAVNNASWDAFDTLLTDDFKRHSQATPGVEVNSREDFVNLQESFLEACPDQKITMEMMIAEGDKVAVYATLSGTQTGPFGDFPPKGKSMDSKFITIFRIEDGRIAEIWVEWDNLAILSQLGHFPLPDTTVIEK